MIRRQSTLRGALVVCVIAATAVVAVQFLPDEASYRTYKGAHGEVFLQFDHDKLTRYGVADKSRSSAHNIRAVLVYPNGARGTCGGSCATNEYWTELYYVDNTTGKEGILVKTNKDAKTNVIPSTTLLAD